MLSYRKEAEVQDGNAEINVRGGRGSEVLYIVDGVAQNNLYNRETVSQVSNSAIDQISFQVGGYEAKYGQAQSGIVNVTTKSGQPYYSIFADVQSSGFFKTDDYGANLYSGFIKWSNNSWYSQNIQYFSQVKEDGIMMLILQQFRYQFRTQ